jgi:glycosyltransferase involved in cell wall biosynthesis
VSSPTLLSVNNYYYPRGGAEVVFLEHNRLFERQGWRVVPFSMKHSRNLPSPWSEHFVDEIELGVDYTLMGKLTRVPKVVYSFEARKRLARLLDIARPDVCHAHNIYHHISPSILGLLKERKVPTVLTLHDLKVACPAYSMLARDGICERCRGGRLHNVVLQRCIKGSIAMSAVIYLEALLHEFIGSYRKGVDRFVVPSQFYIEKLVEWGIARRQLHHIPNFVDAARLQANFRPGESFVYVGRLSREKGLATLLRAAASARVPVTLIGNGPLLEELRQLATELQSNVTFAGYLSGADLHRAIGDARAVVLPSEWYENAPLSVLEAFALGKPVIGARIGGIPELVRDGETGWTFGSGAAEELAARLSQVASSPDNAVERVGRNARSMVEQEYSTDAYRQRVVGLYQALGVDVGPAVMPGPAVMS